MRDGLKPVQRRILYTMWQQNLTADAKHRKCATVVGDVMGNYHPHGDSAIYETLVRMAQSFSLRYPLVDGSGNFGSLDGDSAAAMRYTECRLARIATSCSPRLDQDTVPFRPNYDGTTTEPVVLPARVAEPPDQRRDGHRRRHGDEHPAAQPREVCTALDPAARQPRPRAASQLCRYVKGPTSRPAARSLNSADELKEIYETGQGAIRLRGTWEAGPATRASKTIVITSIPYARQQVGARRAHRRHRRRPQAAAAARREGRVDRRRAHRARAQEGRRRADGDGLPLQEHAAPDELRREPHLPRPDRESRGRPARAPRSAGRCSGTSSHFRLDVVTQRLEHELRATQGAIHILEGFEKVFDALDEILKIIREVRRQGRRRRQDHERFELDAEQTDAILELKLYRLARLEILVIRNELDEKRKRDRQITPARRRAGRWALVRSEVDEVQKVRRPKRTPGGPTIERRR